MSISAERDAVIQALHKIEEYLETNIIPRLKFANRVSVDFGELKRYGGRWRMEHEHSLTVYADGVICYRTGGLILRFKPDLVDSNTVFNSWTYGKDLIFYWQEVKNSLLEELGRKERENSAIMNFQV